MQSDINILKYYINTYDYNNFSNKYNKNYRPIDIGLLRDYINVAIISYYNSNIKLTYRYIHNLIPIITLLFNKKIFIILNILNFIQIIYHFIIVFDNYIKKTTHYDNLLALINIKLLLYNNHKITNYYRNIFEQIFNLKKIKLQNHDPNIIKLIIQIRRDLANPCMFNTNLTIYKLIFISSIIINKKILISLYITIICYIYNIIKIKTNIKYFIKYIRPYEIDKLNEIENYCVNVK